MRRSIATQRNQHLGDWSDWAATNDNETFFTEALQVMRDELDISSGLNAIGLVGSRDLPGVTIRQAQSILRWDRRPSLWSHAFLIDENWNGRKRLNRVKIREVPLFPRTGEFPKPENNGQSRDATIGHYSDPDVDANVALMTVVKRGDDGDMEPLSKKELRALSDIARNPNYDRTRFDLWGTLGAWQRYLWSDGEEPNPLRRDVAVPSSLYCEMVYEAVGLDLVPGASERNSAPEHLWNAAVWWHQQEAADPRGQDSPFRIVGCFAHRDPGCAMLDTK